MSRRHIIPVLTICLATPLSAMAGIDLTLKSHVSPTLNKVFLRDVADIDVDNDRTASMLEQIYLDKSPRLGYRTRMTRSQIEKRIRRSLSGTGVDINWHGARQVVLVGAGQVVATDALDKKAKQILLRHLQKIGKERRIETFEVNATGKGDLLSLPRGKMSFRMKVPGQQTLRPRMHVWIDILLDGKRWRSLPRWYTVKAYRPVYVARYRVRSRHPLHGYQFETELRNVANLTTRPLALDKELNQFWLSRGVEKGRILTEDIVKPLPDIRQEEKVNVVVNSGKVRIVTTAWARADGRIGDTIPVQALNSPDTYQATVIGERTVEVQ